MAAEAIAREEMKPWEVAEDGKGRSVVPDKNRK